MWLPTQAQVNAATRHVASFAGGAIMVFGLAGKINPDTVNQLITQTGVLVNDAVLLLGLLSPIVAAYFASKSASTASQVSAAVAVAKSAPGPAQEAAAAAIANAAVELPGSQKLVNPALAALPSTSTKVTAQ